MKKHIEKCDELIVDLTEGLRSEVRRLCKSGGIDPGSYSSNEYVFAKIVISAALVHASSWYLPIDKGFKKAIKNLTYF